MQLVDAPGARVVAAQVTAPTSGSVTTIESRVTLPVFVTSKSNDTVSPAADTVVVDAFFTISTPAD